MTMKCAPIVPDDSHDARRARGRPSQFVPGFRASSIVDHDSPGSFRAPTQRTRRTKPVRVTRHRPVKRTLSGASPVLSGDLEEQILDLPVAADEFGIPKPSASLVEEARRILWDMGSWNTGKCLVYLMPDGAMALDVRGVRPDGIFISLREDGTARCSGEIEGKVWRKPYASSRDVPDDDLLGELFKLRFGANGE